MGQSIKEFYRSHSLPGNPPQAGLMANGHFNVYRREDFCGNTPSSYSRRDFYKISLVIGRGILYYADKGLEINKPALMFSNPVVPYSWEPLSEKQTGFFCVFTDDFINEPNKALSIAESPLFRIGGNPIYFLNAVQLKAVKELFNKMRDEISSEYAYKFDLLRNYTHLLIHEAMKMQPAGTYFKHANASTRITTLFLELLERQFPIDTPAHVLQFKTAADYASSLSVHVNHLNRAVKEVTGKTTTEHISNRVIQEAKALLLHTNWNVAEIGYSLGFESPSYFNNFFRKQTTATPLSFRD